VHDATQLELLLLAAQHWLVVHVTNDQGVLCVLCMLQVSCFWVGYTITCLASGASLLQIC
jgi:hypothetical protein